MTIYQPSEEEAAVVGEIATKVSELQSLIDRAAKLDIEVDMKPITANFFLLSSLVAYDAVPPVRLSWTACKVRIDRKIITGS